MDFEELRKKANLIRKDLIKMLLEAGSGHSAGPLGMADIFTALYFDILNHDPKNPAWEDRDRLFLSNGHIVPIRYVTMAQAALCLRCARRFEYCFYRLIPRLPQCSGHRL